MGGTEEMEAYPCPCSLPKLRSATCTWEARPSRVGFLRGQGVLRSNLSKSQGLHTFLSVCHQVNPVKTALQPFRGAILGVQRVMSQVQGGFVGEPLNMVALEGRQRLIRPEHRAWHSRDKGMKCRFGLKREPGEDQPRQACWPGPQTAPFEGLDEFMAPQEPIRMATGLLPAGLDFRYLDCDDLGY